jgi:hypothetical protein
MKNKGTEPQSYGSQEEWVQGRTGQSVNQQKSEPDPKHADFYENRHGSETSDESQGGKVSDVQKREK